MRGKYFLIAVVGLVLWIGETAYFGFNEKPENGLEMTLDILSTISILWGIIGDILQGVVIHKHTHNQFNETHNITTKKVEVVGDNQKVNYVFGTTKDETRELLAAREKKEK